MSLEHPVRGSASVASEETKFALELPSDLRLIEATVGYLEGRCRAFAFQGPRLDLNFRVGVTEALANAVLYGNESDPGKTIRVEVTLDSTKVEIRVIDQGPGFDPGQVSDPTMPENIQSPGGRGLFLIRKLMDEIEYNDRGNAVRMVLVREEPQLPAAMATNHIRAPVHRSNPALSGTRELVREYAKAHGIGVWLWERVEDRWTLALATSGSPGDTPGGAAMPVAHPAGVELLLEIVGPEEEAGKRAGAFLARVLSQAAQYDAESRFFGRELAERYEEITLLYTISEVLGSVISLEEAAGTILSEVTSTMGVERAALWVFNPATNLLERVAAVGENWQDGAIRADDEGSMTAAVFRGRIPMMLEPGEVFPRDDHYHTSHHDFFLSVPVSYSPPRGETRTVGVINLIGRTFEGSFSAGDQKLITAIASQIGAAVENSRLVADSVRQERLSREMELAHDLQLKLLPSTDQFKDYFQVAARCAPAESVGGDFYHLFRLPGGRIGVMIGDVSSHGFAAALIMALTMSAVAIHASEGDPPAEVLRRAHHALIDELENTEMYLTLFYGVIDPSAGSLTYASAGHSGVFRVTGDGTTERIPVTTLPFGLSEVDDFADQSIPWKAGEDLLFLFTDGLSDALGTGKGEELLLRRVAEGRDQPLDQLLDTLFALDRSNSEVPADDRSAVLLRV